MRRLRYLFPVLLGLVVGVPAVASANDQQILVDKSATALQSVLNEKGLEPAREYLKKARGIMIVPELVKAGLIVGGEGGNGVLVTKDSAGNWSNPAFYQFIAGSVGLQIGVESKEVLFMVMTDDALDKLMRNEFRLGADASISVGPVGAGVGASSVGNAEADIIAYSKSKGLFGGGAIEGGVIQPKADWNAAYYNAPAVTAESIVLTRQHENPGAAKLRQVLSAAD